MTGMSEAVYWMWFADVRAPVAAKAELISYFGSAKAVFDASREDIIHALPGLGVFPQSLLKKDLDEYARIADYCHKYNVSMLGYDHPDYPERLRGMFNPAWLLYVHGTLPPIDKEPVIGVVGPREPSEYAVSTTYKIAGGLARLGTLIVSGMARGVDAAAHRAALDNGGKTVGVLGCGIDIYYPAKNIGLRERIIRNGAVITDFKPGTPPNGPNFPVRNRIISGLSLGVLLSEAPMGSGSLITASHALEQGRDVFVIPSGIDTPMGAGSLAMIKDGAKLVTEEQDIIEEYMPYFAHKLKVERSKEQAASADGGAPGLPRYAGRGKNAEAKGAKIKEGKKDRKDDAEIQTARPPSPLPEGLSDRQKAILLYIWEKCEHAHVDEIINAAGLPPADVLAELTMLEIMGFVKQEPGKFFKGV